MQKRKTWGRLIRASSDVIDVCYEVEKLFSHRLLLNNGNAIKEHHMVSRICSKVLSTVLIERSPSAFSSLDYHMLDVPPDDNHVGSLVKRIVCSYCNIRLHHIAKETTAQSNETSVRWKLTKLVHQMHQ